MTDRRSRDRRRQLALGGLVGAVGLGAVAAFAIGLPEASGEGRVALPERLPGGLAAVDVPSGADEPQEVLDRQQDAVEYVQDRYAEVYDEPVAFRVYADEEFERYAVVTVFPGESEAFGPPNGIPDPAAQGLARAQTELVREGDAVCIASYQPVPEGEDADEDPLGVTCQLPADGHTVQVTSNRASVEDAAGLTEDVADAL